MLEVVFGHYRGHWPNDALEPEYPGSPTVSGPSHSLQPSESTTSLGSEPEVEDMDDLELAKALGVPDHHIERLTPVKPKPDPTPEAKPIETSSLETPTQEPKSKPDDPVERAQWRAKRIEDLK